MTSKARILSEIKETLENIKKDSTTALKNVSELLQKPVNANDACDFEDLFQFMLDLWDKFYGLDDAMDDLEEYIAGIYTDTLNHNGFPASYDSGSAITVSYEQTDGLRIDFKLDLHDACDCAEKILDNLMAGNLDCPEGTDIDALECFLDKVWIVLQDTCGVRA